MLSNILKGTLCVNPNRARPHHIPQTQWKCPPKLTLDSNWYVAAGEESTEAVAQRRDATDPRPSAPLYMDSINADSKTPVIPLTPIEEEEEGIRQNDSAAAFLTTTSMREKQKEVLSLTSGTPVTHNFISPKSVKHIDVERSGHSKLPAAGGDMMSIAMAGAAAALSAYASRQGEQTAIDIGLLMQFLSNPDTVHKLISERSVPGIEPASMLNKPTPSVPFVSSNLDQLKLNTNNNCVRANAGVVVSEPNAWTSSVPFQSSRPKQNVIDFDLLARLLMNPKDNEKLIKEYAASDRSGNRTASTMIKSAADLSLPAIAITPESSLFFPRENTVNEPFSVPQKIFSSVFTASTKMSLINEDLPSPEATMAPMSPLYSAPSGNLEPMSPLYSSPSDNLESDIKFERMINKYGTNDWMRMEPRPRTRLISPVVSIPLPQNELSELLRTNLQPTTNVVQFLLQMSPLPPEGHLHPVLGASAMPGAKLVTSSCPDPFPRTELFTLPKANPQPAANMNYLSSAFGHSTPLMRAAAQPENHGKCLSGRIGQHGGTQRIPDHDFVSLRGHSRVVGQGLSMLKPQKTCIYFNTHRGCWNGTSCPYLHSKSDQAAPSRVEALPSAKRVKLGWETSG